MMQEIFGEFDSDNDELLDEKGGEEDAEWSALCDARTRRHGSA